MEPWGARSRPRMPFAPFRNRYRASSRAASISSCWKPSGTSASYGRQFRREVPLTRRFRHAPALTINWPAELASGPSLDMAIGLSPIGDVDIVGLNCSVGPQPMLSAIKRMRADAEPLIARPNAGLPRDIEGRKIYMATPEYFAEFARYFLQEGVVRRRLLRDSSRAYRAMAQTMRQHRAMVPVVATGSAALRAGASSLPRRVDPRVAARPLRAKVEVVGKDRQGRKGLYVNRARAPFRESPRRKCWRTRRASRTRG